MFDFNLKREYIVEGWAEKSIFFSNCYIGPQEQVCVSLHMYVYIHVFLLTYFCHVCHLAYVCDLQLEKDNLDCFYKSKGERLF